MPGMLTIKKWRRGSRGIVSSSRESPPEETSSLWLIHYTAACHLPSQSAATAEADKASFTAFTHTHTHQTSLSFPTSTLYTYPHSLFLSLCAQMKRALGHFSCRQPATCLLGQWIQPGNLKGSDNTAIWACSLQDCSGFPLLTSNQTTKNRRRLICQPTWGCGKTLNPSLIHGRQDILTLRWISEKANSGDIKMTGSDEL